MLELKIRAEDWALIRTAPGHLRRPRSRPLTCYRLQNDLGKKFA